MELPTIINVKSEKEDFEHEKEKHFLDFHLDIKIESEAPQFFEDWCIDNAALSPSNTACHESGDFQQLTQFFKQQCLRCDRYFDDRYSLLQHNLTHLKIYLIQCTYLLKYKCDDCNIFYNTKDKLKEHTTVIHGSKHNLKHNYSQSFGLEKPCEEDIEENTLCNQDNTSDCDDSLLITKSQNISHSDDQNTSNCDDQNNSHSDDQNTSHCDDQNNSHCDDRVLISKSLQQCTKCDKIFTYKSWFSHMQSVHSNAKSICEICKKTFKCGRYLRRHILYQHGNEKPSWRFHKIADKKIYCEKCPAVFVNKNSLKTHMRNCHTESVECDLCKSKLKSKAYLLTHMRRVHYDDGKEHKCKICAKKFKSPRYVKIHMKNKHAK